MEIWRDIKGYEDYQVSNLGRVRSLERVILRSDGTTEKRKSRVLKTSQKSNLYDATVLYKNKKHKSFLVHRLVAITFIPNPNNLPQVNHINGIKKDNRVENLEWCTHQENITHSIRTGLKNTNGSKNCNALLTEKEVLEIRDKYIPFKYSCRMLAEEYNVKTSTINKIVCNLAWKHI